MCKLKFRPHPGAQTDFMNSKDKRDYSIIRGGMGYMGKTLPYSNYELRLPTWKERHAKSKSHHNAV